MASTAVKYQGTGQDSLAGDRHCAFRGDAHCACRRQDLACKPRAQRAHAMQGLRARLRDPLHPFTMPVLSVLDWEEGR